MQISTCKVCNVAFVDMFTLRVTFSLLFLVFNVMFSYCSLPYGA